MIINILIIINFVALYKSKNKTNCQSSVQIINQTRDLIIFVTFFFIQK